MKLWIILFVINRILSSTCPYTSKIGKDIGIISVIVTLLFIPLSFIFAQKWWYGLIAMGIYFIFPLFIPKIQPYITKTGWWYSMIGSHVNIIILIFMYLSLFNIL